MPQAVKDNAESNDKGERVVLSIPAEITAKLDARIKADGGDALESLGVDVSALRTGFVHKLLKEALS